MSSFHILEGCGFSLSLILSLQKRNLSLILGEYVEWEDVDLKSLSCKHLCLKTNMKVIINERKKLIIQGKVYWIRGKELYAWFLNFQKDDQDDLSSDRESQEGDVANKADNNESDVDKVSKLSFMHENDTAHKDVNSCKRREVGPHLEDPFNIYGLGNKAKWRCIKELCQKHRINFASIQETKVESISLHIIKDLWGNQMFDHVVGSSVGCSGGSLCMWNPNMFVKVQVFTCNYFVALMGTWAPTSSKLLIISDYAPQELNERRDLWDYLRTFIDRWECDTVITGDFNEETNYNYGPSPFWFFHSWFAMEGFNYFVETTWKSLNIVEPNGLIRLKKKFQALKIAIKAWSKEANKRSNDRKINIQQNLSEVDKLIDQGKSNDEILIKRITLLNDLHELNNRNAMEISHKAKIRWSIEGDENSKYFHDQVQDLERTVTYEEVKRAVWDYGTNKSPGPDGFFFEFYLLSYLISDVQSAFVANRQILDGPFILNELLSWCKFKKLNGMIFKVEFEKAFDSVKWDYLDETLKAFGFGSKWCNWISSCLNTAMGSVLVNGSPTLEFQFYKGLKQGDPISPFLFILIMETLHLTFKRVLNASLYKGISLNDSFTISHLFYADDVVFIAATSLIGCSILTVPFNYLGVKVGSNMRSPFLFKVGSHLDSALSYVYIQGSNWRVKSFGIYSPDFFYGLDGSDRKLALIGWNMVLTLKRNGGLSVSSFFAHNRAFLFKWVWRFLTDGSSMWTRFIKAIFSNKGALDTHKLIPRRSPWQDVILAIYSLQSKGINLMDFIQKSWQLMPRGGVEQENYGLLCSKVADLVLPNISDIWCWSLEGS
nr:RNA-directed DNA polymerase, eukaryota, reverse transcriptase zinc-binding domain protein [Tanacetum cinerariifolium]